MLLRSRSRAGFTSTVEACATLTRRFFYLARFSPETRSRLWRLPISDTRRTGARVDPESDVDVLIVLDDWDHYAGEIDRTSVVASKLSLAYDMSIRLPKRCWKKRIVQLPPQRHYSRSTSIPPSTAPITGCSTPPKRSSPSAACHSSDTSILMLP